MAKVFPEPVPPCSLVSEGSRVGVNNAMGGDRVRWPLCFLPMSGPCSATQLLSQGSGWTVGRSLTPSRPGHSVALYPKEARIGRAAWGSAALGTLGHCLLSPQKMARLGPDWGVPQTLLILVMVIHCLQIFWPHCPQHPSLSCLTLRTPMFSQYISLFRQNHSTGPRAAPQPPCFFQLDTHNQLGAEKLP